jgi:hypothetical protein
MFSHFGPISGRALLASFALAATSCAAERARPSDSQQDSAATKVSATSYELTAGEQSGALGIVRWLVEDDEFQAFDAESHRIALLRLDRRSSTVESVYPDQGVKGIRDEGVNSLSERSTRYFDALKTDLSDSAAKAMPAEKLSEDLGNVDKATWNPDSCWYTAASCMESGQNLLFAGIVLDYRCLLFDNLCGSNTELDLLY